MLNQHSLFKMKLKAGSQNANTPASAQIRIGSSGQSAASMAAATLTWPHASASRNIACPRGHAKSENQP